MKPCIGCKHLVANGAACKADEQLVRVVNPLTGKGRWIDHRFPEEGGWRPSPEEMRKHGGRCGPERRLYEPTLLARLEAWLLGIGRHEQ
jgi:hypothetical protein